MTEHDALAAGPDGLPRCFWAIGDAPEYVAYHDDEWGRPVLEDDLLFEHLTLEAFQSGLSWLTILRKRPPFREAFAGFSVPAVAAFGQADLARLMTDAGIVRNRLKIEALLRHLRTPLNLRPRPFTASGLSGRLRVRPAACGPHPVATAGRGPGGPGGRAVSRRRPS